MPREFTKPPLSLGEQVSLLQSRGMAIADPQTAAFFLGEINYYRLGAYWLPFEADHATHRFRNGTSLEQVLQLYQFDRELRLLLLDALERLEVSVRTRWAYELAHRHGPHAHMDPTLARSFTRWTANVLALEAEVERSREVFVAHYRENYAHPELPPVWSVCEVMSLGLLSRWYTQLGPMITRRAIASHFGLDQQHFEGTLEHLTYLRNLCAHHARVWNRRFTKSLPLPRHKPAGLLAEMNPGEPRALYNTLVILLYLMDRIAPAHHWRTRLIALLDGAPDFVAPHMGVPAHYRDLPIWRGSVRQA